MKFKKIAIIVEAEQWFPDKNIPGVVYQETFINEIQETLACVHTLEGTFIIEPGDWIITGVKGERWPVKDDIFKLSYEPIE